MTKSVTVEQTLAKAAALKKELAAHRLPVLKAISDQVAEMDLPALAAQLTLAASLMEGDARQSVFASYATALPGLPVQVAAALKACETEADA